MDNPLVRWAEAPAELAGQLAATPGTPGVAVATVTAAGTRLAAAGVTDIDAGPPVAPDTRFRPGSVTKLLTATLVMQLVDEGIVGLDQPVLDWLPQLALADPRLAALVTVRHLISHTSGIDAGDVFIDAGDGDDCLDRYVEVLTGVPFLFPPGHAFSYSNAGFVLAGLVVARARGTTFENAMRRYLLDPLGMNATDFVAGPASAVCTTGYARGHATATGAPVPMPWATEQAMATRAVAPAGGTLWSTAGDLAKLLAAHLGVGDGEQTLSSWSAAAMRTLQVEAPGGVAEMAGPALGWMSWRNVLGPTVRIGGAFPGQSALLVADPENRTGAVVMTNSDTGINAVTAAIDACGPVAGPVRPVPADLHGYQGDFEMHALRLEIRLIDGNLHARAPQLGTETTLVPIDGTTFASAAGPVAFYDPAPDGTPRLLRWRMRSMRRVA